MTKTIFTYQGELRTVCRHESGVELVTDAPKDNQGKGESFSPTDLVAVALASCMLTLMGIAARKLGIDLKGMTAEAEKEMAAHPSRRIGKLVVRIRCPLALSPEQRAKLEQAALTCPVHASLHPDIKQEIDFVWGL
ncbi:MAG: OsmC family protein [Verrucomicrobiota bacterium]|nr:OsmC family protein [Verrucomicrobiota bacterium]